MKRRARQHISRGGTDEPSSFSSESCVFPRNSRGANHDREHAERKGKMEGVRRETNWKDDEYMRERRKVKGKGEKECEKNTVKNT